MATEIAYMIAFVSFLIWIAYDLPKAPPGDGRG